MVTINHGSFVISLDFELFWGVMDCAGDSYKQNILGVQSALPKILDLFHVYDVKATVATVGFIYFKNKKELLAHIPCLKPAYVNSNLSPYANNFIENIQDKDTKMFFAPDLIELLKKSNNIELATHTFCHYYCWEAGQTIEQFDADIKAAVEVAKLSGIEIKSIVFPRNHFQAEYLPTLTKYGIDSYRGNPTNFFPKTTSIFSRIKNRGLRLLDSYFNVGGSNLISYNNIVCNTLPINIPASRFLRPYNVKLSVLENLKVNRIKKEMLQAAKENKLYHLWWHPHNFGINIEKNMAMLENLLQHYKYLNEMYNFQSYTMNQLANDLQNIIYQSWN